MENKRIAVIGCGNLGLSILNGLLANAKIDPKNLTATRRNLSTLEGLRTKGVYVTSDNLEAVDRSDIVILALKPYNILPVLESIHTKLDSKKHILVSLATGVSIAQIRSESAEDLSIYRAMPNTAADVSASTTCICSDHIENKATQSIQEIFDTIGHTLVIDENLMDSATVLGACGIAYVLRFIRGMIQGGIEIGFDARTASAIVTHTVKGAAELLIQNGDHPEYEIDKVTTPRGCTIAGLNEMEHNGFSSALIKGIVTSYEKIEK